MDTPLLPTTILPDLVRSEAAHLLGWVGDETPRQKCGVFVSRRVGADRRCRPAPLAITSDTKIQASDQRQPFSPMQR